MNNPFQVLVKRFIDALSKYSVRQEDVVGVDITSNYIRLSQLSESKDGWLLEKLGYKFVDDKSGQSGIHDAQDEYVQRLRELIANLNLETVNAAISIPITSTIVRTVTLPLMTDEEIDSAIQYDSLWSNILQLEEKLDEYSIFWQVIRRNTTENTMELLFVASKLSEINHYVQIATRAGLNPVVVDVRCFAIRNALKTRSNKLKNSTAIIEFGPDENYVLIVTDDVPFIYDIYMSEADRALMQSGGLQTEQGHRLYDRFAGQVLQAFRAYEAKMGKRYLEKLLLVSPIQNKDDLLEQMRRYLDGYQVELFDPFVDLQVPLNLRELTESEQNPSVFTSAIGLAARKVDIFGYYKYVTGVNNVNLLPNRDAVRQVERKRVISKLGILAVAALSGVFVVGTLLYQFFFNDTLNSKYQTAAQLEQQIQLKEGLLATIKGKRAKYNQMLDASREFKSNQASSYNLLSAVSQNVPGGVWFTVISYDSPNSLLIKGDAANDQVIGAFIDRLQALPMIERASLQNMSLHATQGSAVRKASSAKQFEIRCIVSTPSQTIVPPGGAAQKPAAAPAQANRGIQTL